MEEAMEKLPCGRPVPNYSRANQQGWSRRFERFLKRRGLKRSEVRNKVAALALSGNRHFHAKEMLTRTQRQYPEIGPATVYRTLNLMSEAGILRESLIDSQGRSIYEISPDSHHDHIVCTDCGHIFEFCDRTIEHHQDQVSQDMGFSPVKHQHVIHARCHFVQRNKD